MIAPKKHSTKGYRYLRLDSVKAFHGFVGGQMLELNPHNQQILKGVLAGTQKQIDKGSDWYGTPTPKSLAELESHSHYLGMGLIKKIEPKIKKVLEKYLERLDSENLPKPKITFNDKGIGIFSFERAAMGLHKQYPIDLSTQIDTSITQMNIELEQTQPRTLIRSVYAQFKDTKRNYPSVKIYIMAGGNAGVKGDEMLYVGLACGELVQFLEERDIAVAVYVLFGTHFNRLTHMISVKIKSFTDSLDKNQLLLLSSDPRYFRYHGFKADIAVSNYFGENIPKGLGKMKADMAKEFISNTYADGFVFEQSYSLESAASEVYRIISDYQTKIKTP